MSILLTCNCGKKLQIDDRFAGQQGQCPACGQTLSIPRGDYHVAPPPAGRAAVSSGPPPLPADSYDPAAGQQAAPAEPPPPLTNHGGGQLEFDLDFFVPPPTEIGQLMTAHSTMRQGEAPFSPAARAGIVATGVGVGVLIGVVIAVAWTIRSAVWVVAWPFGLGTLGLASGLLLTRFRRTCSYVGCEGVARFVCSGSREHLVTAEVFAFRDAHELRTAQTRHYTNGVYSGTNYAYTWTDINGLTRYTISGRHNSEPGTPALTDPYYYATAAEFAWTMYLVSQVEAQLNWGRAVSFSLGGNDWVKVSPGRLQLFFKGQTTDCTAEEVAEARIDQGTFIIKRVDAQEGWFSSRGVFKFPYNQLANAQLFLILLDKVVGIRVQ